MKRATVPLIVALSLVMGILLGCASSVSQKPTESTRGQAPAIAPGYGDKAITSEAAPSSAGSNGFMDRMVIYTANLNMEVGDIAQGMDAVTEIVNLAGGIIAGTRVESDAIEKEPAAKDGIRTVYMTLRVPATKYQDVMGRLRKLAVKTPDEDSSSQDVTEEYSDLQSQLRNFEVVEAQYQELLKKANTIDEILKVQQKLNETRGQIERTKGRVIYLERRADMATINLYLKPQVPGKVGKPGVWDPGKVVSEAWQASMVFLQTIATAVLTLVVFFWWVFLLALLAFAVWRAWRGRRRPLVTPGT